MITSTLPFGSRLSYFTGMRAVVLVLACLCAILSGWTPALAQVHDLSGQATQGTAHPAHGHASMDAGDYCVKKVSGCHGGKSGVHPALCSACFAIEIPAIGIDRHVLASARLSPSLMRPLQAVVPEPQFPPPKSS